MPRWLLVLPLAALVLAGALYAFRLGWIAANMTETAAIEAYAARYLAEAGPEARASDCQGLPGEAVWLVVRCTRGGQRWDYHVNRFGGLVGMNAPAPAQATGEPEA